MSTLLRAGSSRAWRPTGPRTRTGFFESMPLAARRRARSPTTSRRRRARVRRGARTSADRDPSRSTEKGTDGARGGGGSRRAVRPRGSAWSRSARGPSSCAADIDADALERDEGQGLPRGVLARRGIGVFCTRRSLGAASLTRRGGRETRRETRKRHEPPVAVEEEEWLVLEPVPNDAASDAPVSWRVRPEDFVPPVRVVGAVRQRDGEAVGAGAPRRPSTTRWGRSAPGAVRAGPRGRRARQEAQLVRVRGGGPTRVPVETRPERSRPDDNDDDARRRPAPVAGPVAAVPPGTSTRGRVLTCSDKLAVWSCVGVQGALLLARGFLAEPVRFASVTIGRKFNRAVGRRARAAACAGSRGARVSLSPRRQGRMVRGARARARTKPTPRTKPARVPRSGAAPRTIRPCCARPRSSTRGGTRRARAPTGKRRRRRRVARPPAPAPASLRVNARTFARSPPPRNS